ncbi:hypothetical protein WJX72_003183 [[Myrmecia] bisecta]|uniref:Uncharacterized protein n=1 Tax=[Myrmecia] bisecta TaxID=41462 RepID=A0AAW1PNC1_9CHLO
MWSALQHHSAGSLHQAGQAACQLRLNAEARAALQGKRQPQRQRAYNVVCTAVVQDRQRSSGAQPQPPLQYAPMNKAPIALSALHDPAHIGASAVSTIQVQDFDGATALANYMQLPVEQYFELDPELIKPLSGNRYLLKVPRVHLFNIWVEPLVEVEVQLTSSQVLIQSVNCQIRGSDLVQRIRLDERFCLAFTSALSWVSPAAGTSSGNEAAGLRADVTELPNAGTSKPQAMGEITGNTCLDVWCETIPPFNVIPRGILEATGNAVLAGLVHSLLPFFMRKLGQDYTRWATDAEYRARRSG